MAFLALIPIAITVTEVVEAAVVGAAATTAHVATKATKTIVDEISESRRSSSSSSTIGCFQPVKQKTIWDWWGTGLTASEYHKLERLGYDTRTACFPLEELRTIIRCEAKVGKPTKEKHGYEQDKNWDGKTLRKVPDDKSKKRGYPDKNGNVWVPKEDMHGGSGWEVHHKDGKGHHHVYEDGRTRRH